MKKLLYLTKYEKEGASSRYRSFNYEIYLQKEFDLKYKPLFYEGYVKNLYSNKKNEKIKVFFCYLKRVLYLMKNKKKFDFVIIEKELFQYCPYFFERWLLKNINYIIDMDDNPKSKYFKYNLLKSIYGQKINKLVKYSKFTTVGNKWYFEEFREGNLKYLPTVIEKEKYYITKNKANKKIIIVWIGSPSTEKYLYLIKKPLENLSKKYNFTLRIIGGTQKIEGISCEILKWTEELESKLISESDIGIMPLYNGYFEKGKCGFKLIQYMASGLPVIASPSPANNEIIDQGINGYIAENIENWEKYLEKLIKFKELRIKFGENSRKKVEENYTYGITSKKLIELFNEDKTKKRKVNNGE